MLDPWDISYYALPCLLTLLTWEAISFTRPPVLSLAGTLAAWLIFRETSSIALDLSLDAQAAVFAVVSVPAIAALAATLYVPAVRRLRLRRSAPVRAVAAPALEAGAAPAALAPGS